MDWCLRHYTVTGTASHIQGEETQGEYFIVRSAFKSQFGVTLVSS